MKILKGILSESREYYEQLKAEIEKRLLNLPKGSIKKWANAIPRTKNINDKGT